MGVPRVTEYLAYRVFLQDWFDARKRIDPDYSFSVFAAAGNCSKSALPNVLSGQRVPRPGTLDAFATAMELSPNDRNFLGLLVEFEHAPDVSRRLEGLQRLVSEKYGRLQVAERSSDDDLVRFLSRWYLPAIYELAGLEGFRDEPAWIARTLCPSITEDQARGALDTLLELDLLHRDESGALTRNALRFTTAQEARQEGSLHYYHHVLPDLLRAIDPDKSADQHVMAAMISLGTESLPEAKARLHHVVEQVATLADNPSTEGKRVYQIAVQLLPVSESIPVE